MNHCSYRSILATALTGWGSLGLWAPVALGEDALAQLRAENARLTQQNAALRESLVEANRSEKESAEALAKIKVRLEALGKNLIDDKDDRAVDAVSDLFVTKGRLRKMEDAAIRLSASVQSYLKTAIASDPESRAQVEARLRELEVALELRVQPEANVERGNLHQAKVRSIDEKSGLVVLNVGEKENTRIGMIFNIMRDDDFIAEVMVADTRPDVCGVFVQKLENENNPVRFGDIASLKSN